MTTVTKNKRLYCFTADYCLGDGSIKDLEGLLHREKYGVNKPIERVRRDDTSALVDTIVFLTHGPEEMRE